MSFFNGIFNGESEILWFIILFILLFYNDRGYGYGCGAIDKE